MSIAPRVQVDMAKLASLMRRMQQLKSEADGGEYPMAKVLRNAARDFAQEAYAATRSAAVSRTPFLQVPDRRGSTYYNAYKARLLSGAAVTPGMTIRGAMRWVKKRRVKHLGLRGGRTPNPPYPVAKGFARATWIGVFRGLGMTTRRPAERIPEAATRAGTVTQEPHRIDLADRLSYIGRLDARDAIVARGVAAAIGRLETGCAQKAEALERRWQQWA